MKSSTHFQALLILTAAFVFASCIENPPSDRAYYDFWYGQMFTSIDNNDTLIYTSRQNKEIRFVVHNAESFDGIFDTTSQFTQQFRWSLTACTFGYNNAEFFVLDCQQYDFNYNLLVYSYNKKLSGAPSEFIMCYDFYNKTTGNIKYTGGIFKQFLNDKELNNGIEKDRFDLYRIVTKYNEKENTYTIKQTNTVVGSYYREKGGIYTFKDENGKLWTFKGKRPYHNELQLE